MTVPPTARECDADLIERSLADPEAFAALFDRYSAMLFRYVSRRLGPACEDGRGQVVRPRPGPIGSAFSLGGAACTRKTVQSLTRIRFDRTMVIESSGWAKMVDALGGVEMTVPEPLAGELGLPAGTRRLNGEQALAFPGPRPGAGDGPDAERLKRRRTFMAALVRRGMELQKADPARFARFLAVVADSVETEPRLDIGKLRGLARGLAKIGPGDVRFRPLPVHPAPRDPARLGPRARRADVRAVPGVSDE